MDAKLLMMAAAGTAGGDFYPYTVDNSLRFDGTTSDYLNFTPGAGNRKLWTFSTWYKRCASTQQDILIAGANSSNKTQITVESSNKINFELVSGGSSVGQRQTTALLRDPSAWYHIVCVLDSANGTPEDRQQIYINGVRVTDFSTNTTTTLNTDTFFNNSQAMYLGRRSYSTAANLDGYLSQTCFIEGQALGASSFGEDKNGVWVPSDPTGLTFGDEGWLLAYASSGALGDDTSGNTNDWTANGVAASDQMPDTPTNNFCTFNPLFRELDKTNNDPTYAEGNLYVKGDTAGSSNDTGYGTPTMFLPDSGIWYAEYRHAGFGGTFTSDASLIGVYPPDSTNGWAMPTNAVAYSVGGGIYVSGSVVSTESTWTTGDIIGVLVDVDAEEVTFYKNGTLEYTYSSSVSQAGWKIIGGDSASTEWSAYDANFGQNGTFNGNVTAGGNSDANSIGDFKYTVPTGALALCTANLPEPTLGPNSTENVTDYFLPILYTGNGTAIGSGGKAVTGASFTPDKVDVKNRDAADSWANFDIVRGVTKYQEYDSQDAQVTDTESLTSFDAGGFTVGSNVQVNTNTEDYVAYLYKKNAGFFDILGYTGTGSAHTEAHSLTNAPLWITTRTESASQNWMTLLMTDAVADPATDFLYLDASAGRTDNVAMWNDTAPTSSVFTVGTNNGTNKLNDEYVAMLFSDMEGMCKVGYYEGNGDADGPFVYCGFRPAFVMIKLTNTTGGLWIISDTARNTANVVGVYLQTNASTADVTYAYIDHLSNGFKLRNTGTSINVSGNDYVFLAFAEMPFKYSNAR